MSKRNQRQQLSILERPPTDASNVAAAGYGDEQTLGISPVQRIQVHQNGTMTYKRFTMNRNSLDGPSDLTGEEWEEMGDVLISIQGAIQWWLGDWANLYHDEWGQMYERLATQTGFDTDTIKNYAWVCRKVQKSLRKDNLYFTHHLLVAGLPDEMQHLVGEILDYAVQKNLSTRAFSQYLDELKMQYPPTLLSESASVPFDFAAKKREIGEMLKVLQKAGQGDTKARRNALGWIAEQRLWLDAVEAWLQED